MFKLFIRVNCLLILGLSVAAGITMTAGRTEAQGVVTPRGNLRPIQPITGGGFTPFPAMPGFVPNPNAVRTVLTPNPAPAGTPPVDPTGINIVVAGQIRPPMRGPNQTVVLQPSQGQQGTTGQGGGIAGGIGGGIAGGIGGIGGGIGGIGGSAGIGGVGGQTGIAGAGGQGLGGSVLQPQFNLQGGVVIPANGWSGVPVIQQPTVGPIWQPANQGGFGGQQIQGGQIQGGIQGIQGGIQGIGGGFGGGGFGGGFGGGKIGFGGLYGL